MVQCHIADIVVIFVERDHTTIGEMILVQIFVVGEEHLLGCWVDQKTHQKVKPAGKFH